MKTPYVAGCVIVAVAITLAIEEARIADLRSRLAAAEIAAPPEIAVRKTAQDSRPVAAADLADRPIRAMDRPAPPPAAEPAADQTQDTNFEKSVRRMWENPAGKSMMNQGVRMMVAMMYGDFIDSLDLTKEEADYFRDLLGKNASSQQELGMKLMGASKEETKELMAEMERKKIENEEAIKTFLNNDEDHKRFKDYEDRMPERQQIDGLRAAMVGKGAPLDAETEDRLVEVMYRARAGSGAKDLSNLEMIESLNRGNMLGDFEKSWEIQQNSLRREVDGVLNDKQIEAFFEYQEQLKEFSLMGIKMAEKMMGPDGEKNIED